MEINEFYKQAFDRNRGLVSEKQQETLRNATIAIPGMGGVGGVHATTLARLGIGNFHIADFDTFSLANFNRQAGAMMSTVDKSKVDVIGAMVADINPHAVITKFGAITDENLDVFLDGVDIIVDGMDFFEIDVRRMIFKRAHEKGIPVVTAAPLGFGSAVHIFDTHGMTFDEYFAINDTTPYKEKIVSFGIGITPSLLQSAYVDPTSLKLDEKRAASSVVGTLACANFVATEVYKILNGFDYEVSPVSFQFDPFLKKLKRVNLWWGNRHPIQRF
jgi:molybdopterin/thiamine biosynthesis adenylyltransferase